MSDNNASRGGVTFFGLLAILFIGLKLAGFIDWPWLWVLAPIWAPIVLAIVVFIVVVLALAVADRY